MKKIVLLLIGNFLSMHCSDFSESFSVSDDCDEICYYFFKKINIENPKTVWNSDDNVINIFEGEIHNTQLHKHHELTTWDTVIPYKCTFINKYFDQFLYIKFMINTNNKKEAVLYATNFRSIPQENAVRYMIEAIEVYLKNNGVEKIINKLHMAHTQSFWKKYGYRLHPRWKDLTNTNND